MQKYKKNKNKKIGLLAFENFDPVTGDKIADDQGSLENKRLAQLELLADVKGKRSAPSSSEETTKDIATGGSLAYLMGNTLINKDSGKIFSATRKKGIIGGLGALASGVLSLKKQRSEYNKQQGARENLVGKDTDRAKAYKKALSDKYHIKE